MTCAACSIGSEGTLGIVTAAWLRLIPAPEAVLPVVAVLRDLAAGCEAIGRRARLAGSRAAALEYLDAGTLAAAGGAFPGALPAEGAAFMVVAEADGSAAEAARTRRASCATALGGRGAGASTPRASAPTWRRCGAGATASRSPSPPSAAAR